MEGGGEEGAGARARDARGGEARLQLGDGAGRPGQRGVEGHALLGRGEAQVLELLLCERVCSACLRWGERAE